MLRQIQQHVLLTAVLQTFMAQPYQIVAKLGLKLWKASTLEQIVLHRLVDKLDCRLCTSRRFCESF